MTRATMQMVQDYFVRIKELEKENTELKHNKKTVAHLADCLEEKQEEQLAQAKQHIDKLLCLLDDFAEDEIDSGGRVYMEQARFFLKETE